MYSLIIREDTIRIPAEYIRAGRKLEEHIDELANDAFECRFDENEDFTLLTFCLLYTSPSPRDKRQYRMPSSA